MAEQTKIEWAHNTFNPWWGCVRVSPGCEKCYAESFAKRTGNVVWGVQSPRRFFGDKHWNEPRKWNARAEKTGERERVFCASMADVFEDREDLVHHRERLYKLIEETPALDWLLLTKRPENIGKLGHEVLERCWLGTTTENQEQANKRIPVLLSHPARVHFLSVEPLLGPIDFTKTRLGEGVYEDVLGDGEWANVPDAPPGIDWIVVGGESGPGARVCDVEWIESVVKQCAEARVACFVKQLGAVPSLGTEPTGRFRTGPNGTRQMEMAARLFPLTDRKGGEPSEWPEHLRVRQLPEVAK